MSETQRHDHPSDGETGRSSETALVREIARLRADLATLRRHRALRMHATWRGMMAESFVRGLALGLGTVLGATMLVSVAAYSLRQIDFVPLIGQWASEIAKEIETQP